MIKTPRNDADLPVQHDADMIGPPTPFDESLLDGMSEDTARRFTAFATTSIEFSRALDSGEIKVQNFI